MIQTEVPEDTLSLEEDMNRALYAVWEMGVQMRMMGDKLMMLQNLLWRLSRSHAQHHPHVPGNETAVPEPPRSGIRYEDF